MILSYLIIALSLFFAPLALGRPASTPTYKVADPAAPAEPNELLGRHYLVHQRREAAYLRSVPATKASPHAQQTTRHMKPFARYFADRSGDTWMHESRRAPLPIMIPRAPADDEPRLKYVNYVSHVGPFAYEPPPPPPSTVTVTVESPSSPTFAQDFAPPSTSTSTSSVGLDPEATASVLNPAAANTTPATTSTPTPTGLEQATGKMVPRKGKRVKAKVRAKVHKGGKKAYKERKRY